MLKKGTMGSPGGRVSHENAIQEKGLFTKSGGKKIAGKMENLYYSSDGNVVAMED